MSWDDLLGLGRAYSVVCLTALLLTGCGASTSPSDERDGGPAGDGGVRTGDFACGGTFCHLGEQCCGPMMCAGGLTTIANCQPEGTACACHSGNATHCNELTGCDPGYYCKYSVGFECGVDATHMGACQPREDRTSGCSLGTDPVCACDGRMYPNACDAHHADEDVGPSAGCPRT